MKFRPCRSDAAGREERGYEFWCPGCGQTHYAPTWASTRSGRDVHWFNDDIEEPTLTPRIVTSKQQGEWIDDGFGAHVWIATHISRPYCVVGIENGWLRYSPGTSHYLAGRTVLMQHIPTTREHRTDMTRIADQLNANHERKQNRAHLVVGIGIRAGCY